MAKQTLSFTVLPNGFGSGGKLRLSVYVTPRLSGASTLNDFPDLLQWTSRIESHGLKFTIKSGGKIATAAEIGRAHV